MPIKIPTDLPAKKILNSENIFVMTETRAESQEIRPLQILLLNLMPTKVTTETQLCRLLGNTPLQIELELLQTKTHKATHTSEEHMLAFYKTFDEVRDRNFDGLIITGAPVEQMDFEEVDDWDELCEIMEWSTTHVFSTFHICWGAQAGLYYHYGVPKYDLPEKLFGIYPTKIDRKNNMLFRGFDDIFMVPQSRHTTIHREDVEKVPELRILASAPETGVFAISTKHGRQIFITGHTEYDADTLYNEYKRDLDAGLPIQKPVNYFPNDRVTSHPPVTWRSSANLLYSNWINYYVYQTTPYDLNDIKGIKEKREGRYVKPEKS